MGLQLKTILLDTISLLLSLDQMKRLLNNDNISYVEVNCQSHSVKENLHNYFKRDNGEFIGDNHDKETLPGELLCLIPVLTEKEWNILCKSEPISSRTISVLIEIIVLDNLEEQTV